MKNLHQLFKISFVLINVLFLTFFLQSCSTVSGIGKDMQDASEWSKSKMNEMGEDDEDAETTDDEPKQ